MIKRWFFTGLGCFLSITLFLSCRHQDLNAVKQLQKDAVRLQVYLDSVYDLQFQFPDSAFHLWQTAAAEAKAKELYHPLFSYYKYAVYNRLILANDDTTAYKIASEATQLASQTGDSIHIGISAYCMGILYAHKEVTDSASYYFRKAAVHLEGGKDWGTLLDAYSNLADMMRLQGDNLNAEKYLLYLQSVTRMRKEWRELAQGFGNLYEVEDELGRTAKAKLYLDSSAFYYQKVNEPDNPQLLKMKAEYQVNHGLADTAKMYFNTSFSGYLAAGDSVNAAIVLLNKASVFAQEKQPDSVLYSLQRTGTIVNPETLPRTSLKNYLELKLSLPGKIIPADERTSLTTKYLLLINTMLEANKKLIGTEYLHKMEEDIKNREILQSTLKNIQRGKTITILIVSAAFLLMLLVFAWLYWRKKQQLVQEKTNLLRHEKNLEVLQMRMNTQLEERSRISQELHDELGATLTSISLAAELLKKKHLPEELKEVNIISRLSSDMVDKMNEIVWSLNTGNDNLQSLVAYIRKFAGSFLEESGIHLQFMEEAELPEMPMQGFVRRSLYLTVKEALNNIVKHAGATTVILQVHYNSGALQLLIQDNGIGITKNGENRWGNGLKNMKAHIKAIGGIIEWTNHSGTRIHIASPLS